MFKIHYNIFYLVMLFLSLKSIESIEPLVLQPDFTGKSLGYSLEYFEDKEKIFDIEQIIEVDSISSRKINWKKSSQESPGFGYTNSAYWMKFSIENQTQTEKEMFLEIAYPLLDKIYFFEIRKNKKITKKFVGDSIPFHKREVAFRNFLFSLKAPTGISTYYLKIETESSMVIPIWLWSPKSLQGKLSDESLILGSYYGILFVMALFNLFLFLSIRDKVYFVYVMLIVTFGIFQSTLSGHSFQYIYPNNTYLAKICIPIFMMASIFWIIQFTRYYLNTPQFLPKTDLAMKIFSGIIFILGVASFIEKYYIIVPIQVGFSIICVIGMNIVAIQCLIQKNRSAKFYILAWGFMLSAILVYSLKTLTVLPNNFFTSWSLLIGSTAEITLLSFGLADRINRMNKELHKVKNDLEKMSQVKDAFLSNISHEIRTPLTTIYGFSELIDLLKPKNLQSVKNYNKEILYSTEELIDYINNIMLITNIESIPNIKKEKIQVSSLIKDILRGLKKISEKNQFDMKLNVPVNISINSDSELLKKSLEVFIKNAIMYSPTNRNGMVSASKNGDILKIEIQDNGIGIEKEEITKIFEKFYRIDSSLHYDVSGMGIGLFLAKRIILQLGGRIEVESEILKGSKFKIFIPTR
ncbi:MAG: sensor histidine kinase [Leptospiraceae bacterium]|nr:sensor histidine kinase [Leptospiraceae bacterium]MCK6381997.1 sensor histidine kinase [Leptospiraceae bacterium]NUM42598.1 sensor histidine kinase [Leptospiraceae bacterium]